MVLSDFLSRQLGDKSYPHQIIPISFNMKEVLRRNYQNNKKATFMVQTRSQSKCVKAPAEQKTSNLSNKGEQEIKPIIIEDTQTIPDLLSDNNQQNCTQARETINLKTTAINQPYPQPVMRPPQGPQIY